MDVQAYTPTDVSWTRRMAHVRFTHSEISGKFRNGTLLDTWNAQPDTGEEEVAVIRSRQPRQMDDDISKFRKERGWTFTCIAGHIRPSIDGRSRGAQFARGQSPDVSMSCDLDARGRIMVAGAVSNGSSPVIEPVAERHNDIQ